MPPSDRQRRALVTRYQTRTAAIGEQTGQQLSRLWLDVGPEFDMLPAFAEQAEPILGPPKAATVRFASALYGVLSGQRPTGINPDDVEVPDRLRDPFIAYWRAINQGNDTPDALISGAARAEAVARDFVTSAGRRTGDVVVSGRYVQWQRLTDGRACDWCISMTVHTWDSSEAADFGHDRCGCTPVPV